MTLDSKNVGILYKNTRLNLALYRPSLSLVAGIVTLLLPCLDLGKIHRAISKIQVTTCLNKVSAKKISTKLAFFEPFTRFQQVFSRLEQGYDRRLTRLYMAITWPCIFVQVDIIPSTVF